MPLTATAVEQQTFPLKDAIKAYVTQLTPLEKTVLLIAQGHLETSFSLENSIGFIAWAKMKKVIILTK